MSVVLFLLSLAGVALSGLGLYEYVAVSQGIDSNLPFCSVGGTFDCAAVAHSAFGTILGAPLGSIGIVFYLWLAFFSLLAGSTSLVDRRFAKGIFVICGILTSLFSIYLFTVTKVYVKTLCPICLGTYLVNFLLLAAAFLWAKGDGLVGLIGEAVSGCVTGASRVTQPSAISQLIKATILYLVVTVALVRAAPDYLLNQKLAAHEAESSLIDEWKKAKLAPLSLSRNTSMSDGDYATGNDAAKVEIVEHSDMECPACRGIYPVLEQLHNDYPKDVRITYKNFPLDNACNKIIKRKFHKYSCMTAEVARCAGEQGKFWEAIDYIMAFPPLDERNPANVDEQLVTGLTSLGLDKEALETCRSSDRQMKKILSDIDEGIALNIDGTPAVYINGKQVTQMTDDGLKALVSGIIDGSIK